MKTYLNPERKEWIELTQRPQKNQKDLTVLIDEVFAEVAKSGDQVLIDYTEKWDQTKLNALEVSLEEWNNAEIDDKLKSAIDLAYDNIFAFHKVQKAKAIVKIETMPGVNCWRQPSPIEKVGLYVPGGSAPLFSSVLMLGIPAKIAGCKEIVLVTPPQFDETIHPAILYTAKKVGINKVFKVGGAQSIAALTLGTETIPKVDKIAGPGNQYVTAAKMKALRFNVAIDMPAGPSEVLVIADEKANPEFIAADLLSQAEHGYDSQVVLVTNSKNQLNQVIRKLSDQLTELPRKEIAEKALENSRLIVLNDIEDCFEFSNLYAPEHLIVNTENAEQYMALIKNAGSVFLGPYSCESAGDYASGTNHTLPTNGAARNYSGVSVETFQKMITYQSLTKQGIQNIGNAIEVMAAAEELQGHKNAVTMRLKSLQS